MLTENSRDESSFWIHLKLKVELMSERMESLIQQHLRLLFIFTTVLHFSLSYGIGVFHFIGFYDSIANTLLKFNVLVSPSPWLFLVAWFIIIVTQIIYVVGRLVTMNRTTPEHFVWNNQKNEQDDAINDHREQGNDQGYESNVEATHLHDHEMMDTRQNSMQIQQELQFYIISCVCQIFWTVSTCEQVMSWSVFFLVCQILVLGHLIHGQLDHHLDSNTNTSDAMRYYWIYCFPHQVNLSWLYYLLVLHLQIVNQQLAMYFKSQITWAFISIAFIFFVGVYHGYLASDNYPTITLSLALLMLVTDVENKDPSVEAQFGQDICFQLHICCLTVAIILLILTIFQVTWKRSVNSE